MPAETDLIVKAQQGDAQAFKELVYKYDRVVLSVAYSYCRNEDDAKDIYQETFIRTFKGLRKFRFESEFSTWLYRIATNVCISFKEKEKNKAKLSLTEIDTNYENSSSASKTNGSLISENDVYENELMDFNDRFELVLEKLAPTERLSFVLKHQEGYKIKEIASMMNCAEGTVKRYLFNATQKLREQLKEFY